MRSPLETFADLLDRSVQEIATSAADARTVDLSRISLIADIWDNNTFPLVSAACAPRLIRTGGPAPVFGGWPTWEPRAGN